MNTPTNKNQNPMMLTFHKLKPYIPYITAFLTFSIIIISLVYIFSSEDESTETPGTPGTSGTPGTGTGGRTNQRQGGGSYSGKSLDTIYSDAGGNDVLSDGQLISTINLSTEKHSCSYLVTYRGNHERTVECTSGCNDDAGDENSNFCKKYRYNDGDETGSLGDTFLDRTFIGRRGARTSSGTTSGGG